MDSLIRTFHITLKPCSFTRLENKLNKACEKKDSRDKKKVMRAEIKQNGKLILSSDDGVSVPMIFKNLCGRNLRHEVYRSYLAMASREFGVDTGTIEMYFDGILVEISTIEDITF